MAKQLDGKSLSEKIELMNQNPYMYKTRLNEDGTVTAYCGCHCLQRRTKKPETNKPPSAYGCAAGAALHSLKIALGIEARIKSIDYPQINERDAYMPFVFEVLENA